MGDEIPCLRAVGTIPGVVVLAAAGRNGPGAGQLRSYGDGALLSWRAPGSSFEGAPVTCAADGEYLLEDGAEANKWLRVHVYRAHLCGPSQASVLLEDLYNNAIAITDIDGLAAEIGSDDEQWVDLHNINSVTLGNVRAWIDPDYSWDGTDGLQIRKSGGAWKAPNAEDHPDVLIWDSLGPGQTVRLEGLRQYAAEAESDPGILARLHFGFDGI